MTYIAQLRHALVQTMTDLYVAEENLSAEQLAPAPNQVALLAKERDSLKAAVARLQRQMSIAREYSE